MLALGPQALLQKRGSDGVRVHLVGASRASIEADRCSRISRSKSRISWAPAMHSRRVSCTVTSRAGMVQVGAMGQRLRGHRGDQARLCQFHADA